MWHSATSDCWWPRWRSGGCPPCTPGSRSVAPMTEQQAETQQAETQHAPQLTVLDGGKDGERMRAEAAVSDLLTALGRDTTRDGLRDTPRRVVVATVELLTPQEFSATTFPTTEGYQDLVLVKQIPFRSLCEHHLLPFRGVATIGYLPGDRLLGLSKIARVVEY